MSFLVNGLFIARGAVGEEVHNLRWEYACKEGRA